MTARHLSLAAVAVLTVAMTLTLSVIVWAEAGEDADRPDDRSEHRRDFDNHLYRDPEDRSMRGPHQPRSRPHAGPMRPRGAPRHDLTPEEVKERLRILREVHPQLAERIAHMKDTDPQRVGRMLGRHWPMIEDLIRMKEHDPKGLELHIHDMKLIRQSHKLSRQLRRHDSDLTAKKKEQLRLELRELVTSHFEVRQKLKERDLAKLERRIEELREQLHKRITNKSQIIEVHFKKLSGQPSGDEW